MGRGSAPLFPAHHLTQNTVQGLHWDGRTLEPVELDELDGEAERQEEETED